MKLVERELGPHHVSCDIGCHLFSVLPPFNVGASTMGYGLGGAGAAAFSAPAGKRAIAFIGDGGFWHNGLASSVGNAVFNKSDNVIIVVDNGYSAATGGQDVLSSKADNLMRSTRNPIEKAVRGVGVDWVRTLTRTYDVAKMRDTLKEALTTAVKGPKIIIAQSECMLNKQRRERPLMRKRMAGGERVVRERFGVDPDTCTGDHSCIRLSGCPSLTLAPNPDPLRREPITKVINSCVGCGLCGEVAHAAVLCPSFYRASVVANPTGWDKFKNSLRGAVIGWLQRRIETNSIRGEDGVTTPSPLAGEGSHGEFDNNEWVRGNGFATTPHPFECVEMSALPSPARGEGAKGTTQLSARISSMDASVTTSGRSPSPSSRSAARAAACSPTGSSIWRSMAAIWRRPPRSRASRSAPARPSIMSSCFPNAPRRPRAASRCCRSCRCRAMSRSCSPPS